MLSEWYAARVSHGYGNTCGVSKMGNMGMGTVLAGRGPMLRMAETSPLYQTMYLYKKIKCKINKLFHLQVFQNS
jgi:hypothetical protein